MGFGEAVFPGLEGAALDLERHAMEPEQKVVLGEDVGRDGAVEGHFVEEDGIAGGDGVGEAVDEVAVGEAGELGGVGGEFAGGFEEILDGEPVEEAAIVPFGEVLGADGDAVEMFGEEGLDFGEGVEPLDEVHAGFAVVEALVELVAEGAGETGDFAGAFHNYIGYGVSDFSFLGESGWFCCFRNGTQGTIGTKEGEIQKTSNSP